MTPPNEGRSEQVDPRITALADAFSEFLASACVIEGCDEYRVPVGLTDALILAWRDAASLLTESGAFAGMGEPVGYVSEKALQCVREMGSAVVWGNKFDTVNIPLYRLPQHGERT